MDRFDGTESEAPAGRASARIISLYQPRDPRFTSALQTCYGRDGDVSLRTVHGVLRNVARLLDRVAAPAAYLGGKRRSTSSSTSAAFSNSPFVGASFTVSGLSQSRFNFLASSDCSSNRSSAINSTLGVARAHTKVKRGSVASHGLCGAWPAAVCRSQDARLERSLVSQAGSSRDHRRVPSETRKSTLTQFRSSAWLSVGAMSGTDTA